MLTPAFELFQDDIFLTVVIQAPFTKISETEIFIEDCDFKFYSKPYFLRLNLPGKIVEDGRETANYDADKGNFTIKVPKQNPGEEFDGLDMLTKLLAPTGQRSSHQPVIEVLREESTLPSEALPEEDIDWSVEQTVYTETDVPTEGPKYGFGSLRSGVFKRLQSELCELVDVKNPDSLTPEERRSQRLEIEDDQFSDDHYLADLYQDDTVQELIQFKPPWYHTWKQLQKGGKKKEIVTFTEEEKEKMRKLPNKEYLIDSCHLPSVYLSLVDILFAYVYCYRLTEGEHNVESGWTICKLSSTLSWLEIFTSLRDVVVACYRRCLCFPLYRHWGLAEAARDDTFKILSLGRRQVLKCLLDIQTVLMDTDQRYVLNDLYISDYCVWIQGVSNSKLESLAAAVQKLNVSKSDVGFSLEELETAARITVEEEEAGGIVGKLEKLAVSGNTGTDSDDTSTDSDEDTDGDDDTHGDDDTDSDDGGTVSDDGGTVSDDENTGSDDGDIDCDDKMTSANDGNDDNSDNTQSREEDNSHSVSLNQTSKSVDQGTYECDKNAGNQTTDHAETSDSINDTNRVSLQGKKKKSDTSTHSECLGPSPNGTLNSERFKRSESEHSNENVVELPDVGQLQIDSAEGNKDD